MKGRYSDGTNGITVVVAAFSSAKDAAQFLINVGNGLSNKGCKVKNPNPINDKNGKQVGEAVDFSCSANDAGSLLADRQLFELFEGTSNQIVGPFLNPFLAGGH